MIYCREKLIDLLLESPWISLEEKFDFDIALDNCLRRGLFKKSEWLEAEHFLNTGESYNHSVERVILILMQELGYGDERFLKDLPDNAKAKYNFMDTAERGVRL